MNIKANLDVTIRPKSEAGGLNIIWRHMPGDVFDFRTCEGVVYGNKDLGLFQVKMPTSIGNGIRCWRKDGNNFSYMWPYKDNVDVHIVVEPKDDHLLLTYSVLNVGQRTIKDVQIHTCIPTTEAPNFYPQPFDKGTEKSWSELYDRLFVWINQRPVKLSSTSLGASQPHLSLVQKGKPEINWGWWVNTPERFDIPLIALTSHNRKSTIALAFENARWASSNTGDDRACFHLFPWFGTIEPGQRSVVTGSLLFTKGGPESAMHAYRKFLTHQNR